MVALPGFLRETVSAKKLTPAALCRLPNRLGAIAGASASASAAMTTWTGKLRCLPLHSDFCGQPSLECLFFFPTQLQPDNTRFHLLQGQRLSLLLILITLGSFCFFIRAATTRSSNHGLVLDRSAATRSRSRSRTSFHFIHSHATCFLSSLAPETGRCRASCRPPTQPPRLPQVPLCH